MIRITVTDDHPMILEGLANVLEKAADICVSGIYSTGKELQASLLQGLPDVLLLDLQLPDFNGAELVELLLAEYPALNILILSSLESATDIRRMMQLGCKGYLLKSDCSKEMLLESVRKVYSGDIYIAPAAQTKLVSDLIRPGQRQPIVPPRVTRREQEVLALIAQEYNNQQIAQKLFINIRTVEAHRYNLQQKLQARNTIALVRIARETGLLQ